MSPEMAHLRHHEGSSACLLPGGLCCKSLLSIWARNIDSRSSANTQQRFKRTGAPIRLFQISISQSPLGDFCNTIGGEAVVSQTSAEVRVCHSGLSGIVPGRPAVLFG